MLLPFLNPFSDFSINFLKYLFIWLHQVCYHTWDLVPWPGIEPGPPALLAQSLSRWTTREVPLSACLSGNLNSLYEGPPAASSGPALHHYLVPLPLFFCSRDGPFPRATRGQFGFSFTVELLDLNSPFFDHNFLSFLSPPSYFSHSLCSPGPDSFPDPQCSHPSTCACFLPSQANIEKIIQSIQSLAPLSDLTFGLDSTQHTLQQSSSCLKPDPLSFPLNCHQSSMSSPLSSSSFFFK